MTKLTDLLPHAAYIRDATEENENTAERVGGFLVTFVQALIDSMPAIQIEGNSLEYRVSEDNFVISMKMRNYDATEVPIDITIPAATIQKAGLMTAQEKIALGKAYVKPEKGIPYSDLSQEVKNKLDTPSIDLSEYAKTSNVETSIAKTITPINKYIIMPRIGAISAGDGSIVIPASPASVYIEVDGCTKVVLNDGYKFSYLAAFDKTGNFLGAEPFEGNVFDISDLSTNFRLEIRGNGQIYNSNLATIIKTINIRQVVWGNDSDANHYWCEGVYTIIGKRGNTGDNLPIVNTGDIRGELKVLVEDNVVTQILTLNNAVGGDGNIYIRSRLADGTWKPWAKMQGNIEVGSVDTLDNLTGNGMYSGILQDTTETFVLVVINNYAISVPTGTGWWITQLKYSVDLEGTVSVKTRNRDYTGAWSNWEELGGSKPSELLVPSEWQGRLSTLSDGVYEFYGDCGFGKSENLWGWADGYRKDAGEPTYIKLIKKGQYTGLAQVIGTAASATRMINTQTETVL